MFVPRLLPQDLIEHVGRWRSLKRWERREVAQTLRRMGLSFREIAAVIPVHKGTLSGWCSDIELDPQQLARLHAKRPILANQHRVGIARRMRARKEREMIRSRATEEARALIDDPVWMAGTVAYWSEGGKKKELRFANSDPDLVRLFLNWAERYLGVTHIDITVKLHLHSGQSEEERKQFWSCELGIPTDRFGKTYVKPEGTGHRKNTLYAGTASLRVARSGQHLQRVLGWIDALRSHPRVLG